MTEQLNSMQGSEQKKKPIALAVTLVLLVISLILVVMFSAKSIGYKQELQVATGEKIVEHFKQLDGKLAHLQTNTSQLVERAGGWDEAAQLLSAHSQVMLQDVYDHLAALLELGKDIEPDKLGDAEADKLAAWHEQQQLLLLQLAAAAQASASDQEQLQQLSQQAAEMKSAVSNFNFKMEGNRNAMIRLAAGFDWLELAKQMEEAVKVAASR